MFVYDMKLTNVNGQEDLFLQHASQTRRVWQMGLYAHHLATGSTLLCKSIKSDTIKAYLADVAKFLRPHCGCDPRHLVSGDKAFAPVIKSVFDEAKRWEQQTKRREPFTIDMWNHIAAKAASEPQNNALPALRDWFALGLHIGARSAEWAQEPGHGGLWTQVRENIYNDPYAFCLGDIKFYTAYKVEVTAEEALRLPLGSITRVTIRFRQQKNSNNGELITLTCGAAGNLLNPCTICLSIVARFVNLVGFNYSIPLALYRDQSGTTKRITTTEIENTMRAAASEVYNITDTASLARWGTHSIRVGALVILYAAGFTDPQLQMLLRWQSDAYMAYVRALGITATRQTNAISDSASEREFL
jgi:hypothetical protein